MEAAGVEPDSNPTHRVRESLRFPSHSLISRRLPPSVDVHQFATWCTDLCPLVEPSGRHRESEGPG